MQKKALAQAIVIVLGAGIGTAAFAAGDGMAKGANSPTVPTTGAITKQNLGSKEGDSTTQRSGQVNMSNQSAAGDGMAKGENSPTVPTTGAITEQNLSKDKDSMAAGERYGWRDRDRRETYEGQKAALENALAKGNSREDYRQILHDNGYRITAIQADTPTQLDYEVVGKDDTYEVQMTFAEGQDRAKSVSVEDNLWRASETVRAMNDYQYRPQTTGVLYDRDRAMATGDANRMDAWTKEKAELERILEPGKSADAYRQMLEERGYQITATNERDADEIELEVVKGKNTYEISMNGSDVSKSVSDIEVNPNIWHAEGTERALGE
ncbi:MAG: hypothetical protein R3E87_13945 [Burkholderiaceae bacterium]